jgi:hypothetical protein
VKKSRVEDRQKDRGVIVVKVGVDLAVRLFHDAAVCEFAYGTGDRPALRAFPASTS